MIPIIFILLVSASYGELLLIPQPKEMTLGSANIKIPRCSVQFVQNMAPQMQKIAELYNKLFLSQATCATDDKNLFKIIMNAENNADLYECKDESYEIKISENEALLNAKCSVGIIRAIATLYQIIKIDEEKNEIIIESVPIQIRDSPRFGYRGLLIDTSRHFMSKTVLKRIIDGMMLGKLNVLHWHMSDDDSFTMYSPTFPKLAEAASFGPKMYYTESDIKELVEYAQNKGVRVIPELDNPSHTRAIGLYEPYKSIVTCFDKVRPYNVPHIYKIHGGPPGAALDPSMDTTYQFVEGILKDAATYFKDELMHLGGDEIAEDCWDERPAIKEFMKKNNILDYDSLLLYYLKRERELLRKIDPKRTAIYWTAESEFKVKYTVGDVLQYWGESKNMNRMYEIFPMNKFILSPNDFFYLDCGYENPYGANSWCGDYRTWTKMYSFEPTNYKIPESKILGAEACAWAELINEDNIENKLWPRVVAMAAVMWEPKRTGIADLPKLVSTLTEFNKKLNSMGIRTSPITGHYCELKPHECFQKWE